MAPQASNQATDNRATPIRGWVNTFYRHYRGKKLGPYHVRRWKENGRLHKQYIKPGDVEKVRAQCQAHRDATNYQRSLLKDFKTFKGNWNYYFRIIKRLEKRDIALEHQISVLKVHKQGFFVPDRPPLRRRFDFMVPRVAKRQFQLLHEAFWKGYNQTRPQPTPEETFAAQARDLKKAIFGTIKPRKRRLTLLATL